MNDNRLINQSTILAADIGGTNSRFAVFLSGENGELIMSAQHCLKTAETVSFADLLEKLSISSFPVKPEDADIMGIAIAGPIENNTSSSPPLIPWSINISEVQREFRSVQTFLINDFVAQAYACLSPVGKEAQTVLAGVAVADAAIAVIGAGTGLGKAILVPGGMNGHHAMPSEGAHSDFPFLTDREFEFSKFLRSTLGISHVTHNHVVSGIGLSAVHRFLANEQLGPREVADKFEEHPETLLWASRFYGRACRNFVLETLALGGLYIAGGIASKNPALVMHEVFRDEFYRSDTIGRLLRRLPVRLITDDNSGLWGVAVKAATDLEVRRKSAA